MAPSVVHAVEPEPGQGIRVVRATGTTQALKALSVRVPQIAGQSSRVTLVNLIPNGSKVRQSDILAEFDLTALEDEERETLAKILDFSHQVEERTAKARSDGAKRISQMEDARAELSRALIQLKKGPVLNQIDRLMNEERAAASKAKLDSLAKSHAYHEAEEKASVRVLELKKQRQQVTLERIRSNKDKLVIKAPQDGMVALENVWRNGSQGPPQEGDQMYAGQPVLRIFDPLQMVVDAAVNEPDFAALSKQTGAKVFLDAYPDAAFTARLESASPVASAGLDSPVRVFAARFRVDQQDPRLLPDLSASLEIVLPKP
ncbi:MAG: HlyD family efflux transporter periplasmic adaptor subunit [Bryobacterales bacterium]|nr:HlyD family efflux transporter periplasmic adaptor subunit [Bryobacterales bacterium]